MGLKNERTVKRINVLVLTSDQFNHARLNSNISCPSLCLLTNSELRLPLLLNALAYQVSDYIFVL